MDNKTRLRSIAEKLVVVAFAGTMLTAMTACGAKQENTNTNNENSQPTTITENSTNTNNETPVANAANTTTPTQTTAYVYNYTPGTLNIVMNEDGTQPAVENFTVSGMVLAGNQHEGGSELIAQGYKTTDFANEFYLNEWIEFYFDDPTIEAMNGNTSIIAVPQKEITEYTQMPLSQLQEIAETNGGFVIPVDPLAIEQVENLNHIGSAYVNMDAGQPGAWEILIVKGGKVAYYIPVTLLPSL